MAVLSGNNIIGKSRKTVNVSIFISKTGKLRKNFPSNIDYGRIQFKYIDLPLIVLSFSILSFSGGKLLVPLHYALSLYFCQFLLRETMIFSKMSE